MDKLTGKKLTKVVLIVTFLTIAVLLVSDFGTKEVKQLMTSGLSRFGIETEKNLSFVRFLDVGQSDCALIYSGGESLLIDASSVAYENEVCSQLSEYEIQNIDVVLISHHHTDHNGSLVRIAEDYKPENLIMPEISSDSEGVSATRAASEIVAKSGGNIYIAQQGMHFNIGEFEITVLAAYNDYSSENNRSVFVMAEIDGVKFLFSGDAETEVEERILKENINLDCDVFKLAHHGADTSNTKRFLKALTPEYGVVSCGLDNLYGHPDSKVISRCRSLEIKVFRTDEHGDVTFYVKNGEIEVKTEK